MRCPPTYAIKCDSKMLPIYRRVTYWVWERESHINWSMVTCQGTIIRLELSGGLLALFRWTLGSERHRYAIV